jgi:glycosyltransferase involved in cell wall biosynthesis
VKISATIITLNEERNIRRAIESLRCVDEIVIIDSGSTDRTVSIASKLGAKVISQPFLGFVGQKNFAADRCENDWILSLDADEALSELLEAEISALKADGTDCCGFDFPRRAQYLGRWINHSGWYPDRKIRLYDRRKARWTGGSVHESVAVDESVGASGPIKQLTGDLLHYTCDSVGEHLRTLDRYTSLAANELKAKGITSSWARIAFAPVWTGIKTLIFQQGFRDGAHGVLISGLAAVYVFLKHLKTRLP